MVKTKNKTSTASIWPKSMDRLFNYTNDYVSSLNNSKLFAGLMIIVLNIASKFVTIKLSKTMEAYLKYTFSKQILIFAIAWMGTRDIYIAIIITLIFVFLMDFLFNEESQFCVLPEAFTNYHVGLLDTNSVGNLGPSSSTTPSSTTSSADQIITPEEIEKAKSVLERAKLQSTNKSTTANSNTNSNTNTNSYPATTY